MRQLPLAVIHHKPRATLQEGLQLEFVKLCSRLHVALSCCAQEFYDFLAGHLRGA